MYEGTREAVSAWLRLVDRIAAAERWGVAISHDKADRSLREMTRTRSGDRRVLFVTFRFPPHGGGGVHRASRFVKYLPEFGWSPHVLTGPIGDSRPLQDASLLDLVPAQVPVTRTGYFDTQRAFRALGRLHLARVVRVFTPSLRNMDAGWIPYAYRAGLNLLRERQFDLIFSSSYPISCHVAAYLLKRATGLPWVADYRDEWSTREVLKWPTPLHRRLARAMDRTIIAAADLVVTTSPVHTERFVQFFPSKDEAKYVTITNGFDEDDFSQLKPPAIDARERFTMRHVGSLFAWRAPAHFLAAIQTLIDQKKIPADRIAIEFVGNTCELGFPRLREMGVIRITGYIPHREAIERMRAADVLLLLNTESTNVPVKTYEYLASGRPILAVTPPGPTSEILRDARAGWSVQPGDADGLAGAVLGLYRRWEEGELAATTDPSVVRRYSRRALTRGLARLFDSLVVASSRAALVPGAARVPDATTHHSASENLTGASRPMLLGP